MKLPVFTGKYKTWNHGSLTYEIMLESLELYKIQDINVYSAHPWDSARHPTV